MTEYEQFEIKSFKHNGSVHRIWYQNWKIPNQLLLPMHQQEDLIVLVNDQTKIKEASGKEWVSRVPSIAYFPKDLWYNIIALMEPEGVRFYCNIASPRYMYQGVLTYIDYDLDVIRSVDGQIQIVDQEEYDNHRLVYRYPKLVETKVRNGLNQLLSRLHTGITPFGDNSASYYYQMWNNAMNETEIAES
jgi:protein associated with RNAse G/E